MEHFAVISDGYIIAAGIGHTGVKISEDAYNSIITRAKTAPEAPLGYAYRLRADTLEWELVELPPVEPEEEELTAEEIVAAIQEAMS